MNELEITNLEHRRNILNAETYLLEERIKLDYLNAKIMQEFHLNISRQRDKEREKVFLECLNKVRNSQEESRNKLRENPVLNDLIERLK